MLPQEWRVRVMLPKEHEPWFPRIGSRSHAPTEQKLWSPRMGSRNHGFHKWRMAKVVDLNP